MGTLSTMILLGKGTKMLSEVNWEMWFTFDILNEKVFNDDLVVKLNTDVI